MTLPFIPSVPHQDQLPSVAATTSLAPSGVVLGEVLSRDADGGFWLRLPWPGLETTRAIGCLCPPAELTVGRKVAVLFQENKMDLAVIVGPVVAEFPKQPMATGAKPAALEFEAERQITLRCGKSSIQLQADGNLLIRGAYVLSRASGTNRIRGGNVQIN